MNIIVAPVVTFEEEEVIHITITITGEGLQGEIIVEVVIHMAVEEEEEEEEDGGMIMEGVVCHHPGEGIIIIIFIKVAVVAVVVEFQKEKEIFMEGIMEDNIHLTRHHPNVNNNKEEEGE